MNRIALLTGGLLIIIGLVGFLGGPAPQDGASALRRVTALIPAAFGLLIGICGALAYRPDLKKHAMHAALAIAGLGSIVGLTRGVTMLIAIVGGDEQVNVRAAIFVWLLGLICLGFIILGVRSFIAARRIGDTPTR